MTLCTSKVGFGKGSVGKKCDEDQFKKLEKEGMRIFDLSYKLPAV